MSNTTPASEKIMDRVAALLRIAEHPNTGEHEAATALRQANSLITKHAIDEAILRQSQTVTERRAISHMTIVLGGGEFRPYLRTIFEVAAETFRVSVAAKHTFGDTEFHLYGASEDVSWLDMLYNMIKLQFLTKLDPTWDTEKGYDENIYNFKIAGYKWSEIDRIAQRSGGFESRESTGKTEVTRREAERLMEIYEFKYPEDAMGGYYGYTTVIVTRKNGFFHKLKAAYVRHAKVIGDDTRVKTQSHEAYRLSFAESFRTTMTNRLWDMQKENSAQMDTIPGAALAIADVKEDADRAMWVDFPNLSPEEVEKRRKAFADQIAAERKVREDMLAAMTSKERQAFLENEEKEARAQARKDRAWNRKNTRYYSYDQTAMAQGSKAAASVDLTRKAGSAGQGGTRKSIG